MTEVRLFITKPEEREKEEAHVRGALKQCGYPDWAFKRVKEQKALTPEERKQRKGEKAAQRSLGQVSLPYVHGWPIRVICTSSQEIQNTIMYEAI